MAIADFSPITDPAPLSGTTYAARCDAALAAAGTDWLMVHADREHMANVAFLSGFEPRFDEALLVLVIRPGARRVLVTGKARSSAWPVWGRAGSPKGTAYRPQSGCGVALPPGRG